MPTFALTAKLKLVSGQKINDISLLLLEVVYENCSLKQHWSTS